MQDRILLVFSFLVLYCWYGYYTCSACGHPIYWCFFLAYLFGPLVEVLLKIKIPRWLAISIVFIGIRCNFNRCIMTLVPLIWKQLVYVETVFQRGSIGLMQSYYRGFRFDIPCPANGN